MPTAIKLAIINFPKSFQDKPKRAGCKEKWVGSKGDNSPSGGSFPLYAGLFTSCKEKTRQFI